MLAADYLVASLNDQTMCFSVKTRAGVIDVGCRLLQNRV
ncbi:hypothetical protein ABIA28_001504 [Bradyrhizobium elkanii]